MAAPASTLLSARTMLLTARAYTVFGAVVPNVTLIWQSSDVNGTTVQLGPGHSVQMMG